MSGRQNPKQCIVRQLSEKKRKVEEITRTHTDGLSHWCRRLVGHLGLNICQLVTTLLSEFPLSL